MPVRNLARIFSPRSVAVIGASPREGSVGHAVLNNLIASPSLPVFPVNAKHRQLGNLACWPSVGELPETVDLVTARPIRR